MYKSYWELSELPFENTSDARFLFGSAQHEEGLSRLNYVIDQQKGAALLSGVYGCGKSLLADAIIQGLDKKRYQIGLVHTPCASSLELLKLITYALGHQEVPAGRADVQVLLQRTLENNFKAGKRTVLIVDEAHTIHNTEAFEDLRLLLNYQADGKFLLTLLLLGQPELREMIKLIKQFDQRIHLRYHLKALPLEEVSRYIQHRLSVAGAARELFADDALALIAEVSGGIPRTINQLADAALLVGMTLKKTVVDRETVQEAVKTIEGGE